LIPSSTRYENDTWSCSTNGTRGFEYRSSLAAAAFSLPLGVALFFLVRQMETLGPGSMAINVLLEEAIKIILFIGLILAARTRIWKRILLVEKGNQGGRVNLPLMVPVICIVAFAITENLLYFLSFPTSSIYRRLLYSYPIHINTALLYALAFTLPSALKITLYFIAGVLYHLGLNYLSLRLPPAAIYLVGLGNLVVLLLLYWKIRLKIAQRSIR